MRSYPWDLIVVSSKWSRTRLRLISWKRYSRLSFLGHILLKSSFRSTSVTILMRRRTSLWKVWRPIHSSCISSRRRTDITAIFCCTRQVRYSTSTLDFSCLTCRARACNCKKTAHSSFWPSTSKSSTVLNPTTSKSSASTCSWASKPSVSTKTRSWC